MRSNLLDAGKGRSECWWKLRDAADRGRARRIKANMRSWNLHPRRFGEPREYASLALEIIRNSHFNAAQIRLDAGARL